MYPQMLRFFAHVSLFYQNIGALTNSFRTEFFATVVEEYISFLIEKRHIPLIASYVAKLPNNRQVVNYSKLLETISDKEERKNCLKFAKDAQLDIEAITTNVVGVVSAAGTLEGEAAPSFDPMSFNQISLKTTPEDMLKIDSLEWLTLTQQTQYIELLKQGNALMRTFVMTGKVEAAHETFDRLPRDIIDGVCRAWKRKTGASGLSTDLTNLTREYLCFKALILAFETFDRWLRFYHNSRPTEPTKPTSTKFTDSVRYEQTLKGYENDVHHWKAALSTQGKNAAKNILDVLLFPDGGWMRDVETTSSRPEATQRAEQLSALRKQYIPQLTLVAHAVLSSSNRLKDAIALSDIIASEQHQLYREFTSEQISDVLKKLRESCINSLNEGTDALGY